ncbi:MAG: MATE family efflux transporter [Lachnospiraceae bacterium]|nr:MATE family efflux transporter [Lachnospiraceae bacterium]
MFQISKNSIQELNKIAVPLIIQNISSFLIGFVDEMFIGRISTDAYGAIGVAASLMFFIAGVFSYTAVAFNIIGSRKNGEGDAEGFRESLMASLLIDVMVGLVYVVAVISFGYFIFSSVYGLTGEALRAAMTYTCITSPYMLFQMVIFTFNSYYKIKKKTSYIMWASTGAAIFNTVLDYILIFGKLGLKPLGVAGAAAASIVSVFVNMVFYIYGGRHDIKFVLKNKHIYKKEISSLIRISLPLAGEELLEGSVFVVIINAMIAKIGIMEIGAYLLVKKVLDMVMIPMFMYGSAALTLVSENIGHKDRDKVKNISNTGALLAQMIFVFLSAVIIVFRKQVPKLISQDEELIAFAGKIIFSMVMINFFNPIQTIYKYVLQAYGDGSFVLYSTAVINLLILGFIISVYRITPRIEVIFIGLFFNYMLNCIIYILKYQKRVMST